MPVTIARTSRGGGTSKAAGRRALIKGTAMLALSATTRASGQAPQPEAATRLEDVPLGPSATVTVERRDDIALVGLNRPFIQNRIDPPTRLQLAAAFYQFEHDPSLRALVLFGHGEHFSRGIDVDGLATHRGRLRDGPRHRLVELGQAGATALGHLAAQQV